MIYDRENQFLFFPLPGPVGEASHSIELLGKPSPSPPILYSCLLFLFLNTNSQWLPTTGSGLSRGRPTSHVKLCSLCSTCPKALTNPKGESMKTIREQIQDSRIQNDMGGPWVLSGLKGFVEKADP